MNAGRRAERPAGRRVARPSRSARQRSPFALSPRWLFPVIAAVLVSAIYFVPSTQEQGDAQPLSVPVQTTTYGCPLIEGTQMVAGQITAGDSASAVSLPEGELIDDLSDATVWRTTESAPRAVVLTQDGDQSGALGFVYGTAAEDAGQGLVYARCPGIVDEAWFLGLGSADRHFSHLELINLGQDRAVVDLSLWSQSGAIDAVDATGLVIEPGERRRVALQDLAAGESSLALQVLRRRGAVGAVALDLGTGDTLQGTEWQPSSIPPAERVLVSGIADFSDRVLMVVNPGTVTAHVTGSVLAAEGTFVAEGLDELAIEPGTVREIVVPESVNISDGNLMIESDEPITAVVRSRNGNDFSYGTAVAPLTGPALVPIDDLSPRLVLSAIGAEASVRVELFDAQMNVLNSQELPIVEGGSVTVSPGDIADGARYAVLTPTGEVAGGAVYQDGDAVAAFGLTSAPIDNLAPQLSLR